MTDGATLTWDFHGARRFGQQPDEHGYRYAGQ